jgi:hypothetical protein
MSEYRVTLEVRVIVNAWITDTRRRLARHGCCLRHQRG